jgi:hypothetical protein
MSGMHKGTIKIIAEMLREYAHTTKDLSGPAAMNAFVDAATGKPYQERIYLMLTEPDRMKIAATQTTQRRKVKVIKCKIMPMTTQTREGDE